MIELNDNIIIPSGLSISSDLEKVYFTYDHNGLIYRAVKSFVEPPTGLKFTANGTGGLQLLHSGSTSTRQDWEYYTDSDPSRRTITIGANISIGSGNSVYIINKSSSSFSTGDNDYYYFAFECKSATELSVEGDIRYLLSSDANITGDLPSYSFYRIFQNMTSLVNASRLDLSAMGQYCYAYMFHGCTGLVSAPNLPMMSTMDLANGCYSHMFEDCTSLETAPTVTGKNFGEHCCDGMFHNCTSLRTIQDEIEVVNVGYQACYWMFYGCTSLLKAADMPNMTTVGYDGMCSMYSHCTSLLETMRELKPLTLVNGSYSRMFEACTSLTTAMYKIDAMNFTGNWAMDNMFAGCVNLERAPILPAEQLNTNCYTKMFYNCAKINRIECHATNATDANNYMSEWTYGVSPTGTFVRREGAMFYSGVNGIPSGWIEEDVISPLLFTSSGVSTISMVHTNGNNPTIYYSLDGSIYNLWDFSELTLNDNEHLYLRGYNPSGVNTQGAYSTFVIEGNIKITGNLSSLLDQSANATIRPYCFHKLFENCDGLTNIDNVIIDVMSPYCCSYMFSGCTNLTKTPIIRNETLVEGCFSHMFDGCTSLHIVTIEATNISATNCLNNWLNNVAAEGDFKCLGGVSFPTGTSGIPTNWYSTHPFYLVNRPNSSGNNRHFWRGSATTDKWISHPYEQGYKNRAFEMYEGLDGYVHDYLDDRQYRASQSNWSGNLKLYSITDTDGASVYIPCGYGLTGGSYNYRAWIAKYSGVTDYANQATLQGFVNTWGYRKNNTYIATYEKMYA